MLNTLYISNSTMLARKLFLMRSIHQCTSWRNPRQVKVSSSLREQYSPLESSEARQVSSPASFLKDTKSIKYKDNNPVVQKCADILHKLSINQAVQEGEDIAYRTSFGSIRFDEDNKQCPSEADNCVPGTDISSGTLDIDAQYFGTDFHQSNVAAAVTDDLQSQAVSEVPTSLDGINAHPDEVIDRQFFGEALDRDVKAELLKQPLNIDPIDLHCKEDINKDESLTYIDEMFFKDDHVEKNTLSAREEVEAVPSECMGDFERSMLDTDDEQFVNHPRYGSNQHTKSLEETLVNSYKAHTEILKNPETKLNSNTKLQEDIKVEDKEENEPVEVPDLVVSSGSKFLQNNTQLSKGPEGSALDYVLQLRRKQKLDKLKEEQPDGSMHIPHYKNILTNLYNVRGKSKHEMVALLSKSILYNENGLVALCKPYGLRMHGGGGDGGGVPSVRELLPELCKITGAQQLHHVHRLDATTTGVLLLAKDEETAGRLLEMFKKRTIVKNYLTITKGVPSISQGVVDIPLRESVVEGKRRNGLRPVIEDGHRRRSTGTKAVTKYQVLSQCYSSALLLVTPHTGVKHQIRSHLGLALNCPVFADHKYSSATRMLPQKMPGDMLDRLQVRQARVRDLPLMLHASSVFLPQFVDGRNLKISCPPPTHFTKTMKILKLNSKRNILKLKSLDMVDIGVELV